MTESSRLDSYTLIITTSHFSVDGASGQAAQPRYSSYGSRGWRLV